MCRDYHHRPFWSHGSVAFETGDQIWKRHSQPPNGRHIKEQCQISSKGCQLRDLWTKDPKSSYIVDETEIRLFWVSFLAHLAVGNLSFKNNRARWSLGLSHVSDTSSGFQGSFQQEGSLPTTIFHVSFRGKTFIPYYQLSPLDCHPSTFWHVIWKIWFAEEYSYLDLDGSQCWHVLLPPHCSILLLPVLHGLSHLPCTLNSTICCKTPTGPATSLLLYLSGKGFKFNQQTSQGRSMKMKGSRI